MNEIVYLIRFKPAAIGQQMIVAATAEIHGEHLVLLNAKGQINALFLVDIVESWSEIPSRRSPRDVVFVDEPLQRSDANR